MVYGACEICGGEMNSFSDEEISAYLAENSSLDNVLNIDLDCAERYETIVKKIAEGLGVDVVTTIERDVDNDNKFCANEDHVVLKINWC